jgi:hypothetical protein
MGYRLESQKKIDHWENLDVDYMIALQFIVERESFVLWTRLLCFIAGTS